MQLHSLPKPNLTHTLHRSLPYPLTPSSSSYIDGDERMRIPPNQPHSRLLCHHR